MTIPPVRPSQGRSRMLRHTAGLAALSLGLSVVATALPVVGGHGAAPARPVAPTIRQLSLASLTKTPVGVTGVTGVSPSGGAARSGASTDQVATASTGAPMVALSWARGLAPAAGTTVLVRGEAKSGWTAWTATEVAADTDPAATRAGRVQRTGTDPLWLGAVSKVQVRYSSASSTAMSRARVELIDPGASPADEPATAPAASASALAKPSVVSRAGWGADESQRNCNAGVANTTAGAVIHHTAGSNSYTAAQSAGIVRGIYAYHANSLGWCDIGYNALVDKYGRIFEGRYGGLERSLIGAHALGFNNTTFGVSVLGTYSSTVPTSSALSSVERIIAWRLGRYYVDPRQTTVLTSADSGSRYREGTRVRLPVITGHRDTYYTECPGSAIWSRLGTIRTEAQRLGYYGGSSIYKKWQQLGGASGPLGLVLLGEAAVPVGYRTVFAGGNSIYAAGGRTSLVGARIDYVYWYNGITTWGYPLADERAVPGGRRVDFSRGWSAVSSASTGGHGVTGAIRTYWDAKGATASDLRFPTAEMAAAAGGGRWQRFQGGSVIWGPATGARATLGTINTAYLSVGGTASRLGYPTGDRQRANGGFRQQFKGGHIFAPRDGSPAVITYS